MIRTLEEWGADPGGAMDALFADEEYYGEKVREFASSGRWKTLEIAIAAGDWDEAYTQAHALAVACMKLRLVPLSDPLNLLTDRMRTRNWKEAVPLLSAVRTKKKELDALLG